jgi:hypothetical protein
LCRKRINGQNQSLPYLVKDVEVPLALELAHNARLLEQEVGDEASNRPPAAIKLDLHELP